jgi:hypothetical protein
VTAHVQFFGDAEHTFKLTVPMILELERLTGAGIGGLCARMFAGDFRHQEIAETTRLGLIGAGTSPEQAAALVAAYVVDRPLNETFPVAVSILTALWGGNTIVEAGS